MSESAGAARPRSAVLDLTARLITQYAGALPAAVVIRLVSQTRLDLELAGLSGERLVAQTEQVARVRLTERIARPAAA